MRDGDEAIREHLVEELHGGDDPEVWQLAAEIVPRELLRLEEALEAPPRHLLLSFARVPRRRPGLHPDDAASLRLAWEHDRGDEGWHFVGPHPHVRSRRGGYTVTVCIPAGTVRLGSVDALVLWRPRLPWAPPEDREIGRQKYRFRRDPEGRWRFFGVRETHLARTMHQGSRENGV